MRPAQPMERREACSACRRLKIRCLDNEDQDTPCRRCSTVGEACVYEPAKRRGRRPIVRNPAPSMAGDMDIVAPTIVTAKAVTAEAAPSDAPRPALPRVSLASPPSQSPASLDPGHAGHDGMRQMLVSEQLDPGSVSSSTIPTDSGRLVLFDAPISPEDPVVLGLLSVNEADRLVHQFHQHLNPMIALLDPRLHTCSYVRHLSPCLSSAILAAASKFFRPDLVHSLSEHAKAVVGRALLKGTCDVALIQSLMIRVYWKAPTDATAWLRIGEAIRMAFQLRWHVRRNEPRPTDELEIRQKLAQERTWYCLACFDTMYSTIFDLPSSIVIEQIPDIATWLVDNEPYIIHVDHHLAHSIQGIQIHRFWRTQVKSLSYGAFDAAPVLTSIRQQKDHIRARWFGENVRFPLEPVERRLLLWIGHDFDLDLVQYEINHNLQTGPAELVLVRAMAIVGAIIADSAALAQDGSLRYAQDVASCMLSKMIIFVSRIFTCLSRAQQQEAVAGLKSLYKTCVDVDGGEDAATTFVARFIHRTLMSLEHVSRPATRVASPALPVLGHETLLSQSQDHQQGYGFAQNLAAGPVMDAADRILHGTSNGMMPPPAPPLDFDIDGFFDMTQDPFSNQGDDAYWASLFQNTDDFRPNYAGGFLPPE